MCHIALLTCCLHEREQHLGLVTNNQEGGGGYKTGRGAREVLHLRKGGGAEKVLAMLKGGHKKFWGSFYAVACSFSHIVGGGH